MNPTFGSFLSSRLGNKPVYSVCELPGPKRIMEDTMPSQLYVGNLAYSVSNGDLEQLFSQVGQVQSATVIMDKFSGQSKGFGFVEMASSDEASKAIAQFNESELKGRNIKVNEA